MSDRVFISYSSEDRVAAERLCAALESDGLACWIAPRDILPSADWAEQIIDGISEAAVMLLVFSSRSNQSHQVRREVERAIHWQVPVIPLRIENVPLSKSLEYFLSSQHWYDAFEGRLEEHFADLARVVRAIGAGDAARRNTPIPRSAAGPSGPPVAARQEPAPTRWAPGVLTQIESRLALLIGPVATVLVERAARQARDHDELVDLLARDVDDVHARQEFIVASRRASPRGD